MDDLLGIKKNGMIMEITLNRPKANAIDTHTSKKLAEAFLSFRDDPTLRVAIITGSGEKFFSAGWDLKAGEQVDADHGPGGFAGLTELFDLDKPVIAAVNGMAVGGGFELALACDLIVASEHAEFFLPEVSLGIIPDSGGVLRLPKRLPSSIAREMLFTGRRLGAHEARHFGLVNQVVPRSDVMEQARVLAMRITDSAPLAIRAMKKILASTEHLDVEEGYKLMRSGEIKEYLEVLQSQDAIEGQQAFVERRQPMWSGK
ncbi:enoyl-CoA hydratase-related protein [Anaerobacillus sp. MEB173]|uniref:enoyl-CoA hydratase-related protein n=1 Tax=Anaerobacillus sp. MEB173 TaxID=3383345 RepID=UPI003F92194F